MLVIAMFAKAIDNVDKAFCTSSMTLDSGEPFRSCANTSKPEIVWDKVMDLLKFPDYSVFYP